MKHTYIIAEIGVNHNADLDNVKELIDIAKVSGCDAVKFQKRDPDICVPEHQKNVMRKTPWGEMKYIDYKHKMEFGKKEFDFINEYCEQREIQWSASAWDLNSLNFLTQYDLPFIKIPSAKLTDKELVRNACDKFKKVIISTGMSTEEEIEQATYLMSGFDCEKVIMHCNSSYPAKVEDLHLSYIKVLKEKYEKQGFEIGYSGHEFRLGTTVSTVFLGATYIERHITLDRTMWGTDQLSSVEPQGLIKLVKGIRELEDAYGDMQKRVVLECEKDVKLKLRGN